MRKTQQFNVYAAEAEVTIRGTYFADEAEVQRFVDDLRGTPWWDDLYPDLLRVEVRVVPGRNDSVGIFSPNDEAGFMEMLPIHLNELFVLHELSHVLASYRYGSRSHDPWFARTYLETVNRVMGSETYTLLYESFVKLGIDFNVEGSGSGIAL